jgi:hypothetical protein
LSQHIHLDIHRSVLEPQRLIDAISALQAEVPQREQPV